jgi:uroporphyrinogen-III synthase
MTTAPLAGRRILVTRRAEQASALVERLTELGAEVVAVPAIAIVTPEDTVPLDTALARILRYDWLVFTSGNAVRAVADRLETLGRPAALGSLRVACVGPATSHVVGERFRDHAVVLQPTSDFRGEGLLAAFAEHGWLESCRCLLPLGDRARDVVATGLTSHGAHVDAVVAYRTVVPPGFAEALAAARRQRIDLALFASPSAVENFAGAAAEAVGGWPVAVMGPVTEAAARAAGLAVIDVARPSTIEGLIAATLRCLAANA